MKLDCFRDLIKRLKFRTMARRGPIDILNIDSYEMQISNTGFLNILLKIFSYFLKTA
jgi:hypothetical protein